MGKVWEIFSSSALYVRRLTLRLGGVRLWCFARKALFFLRFLPWSVDG